MNHHQNLTRIDWHIAMWGAIATAVSIPLGGGVLVFFSTATGAVLAILNWMAIRYMVPRMLASGSRVGLGLSLATKTAALMGLIILLALTLPINLIAFACGFSALFLGIMTFMFKQSFQKGDAILKKDI